MGEAVKHALKVSSPLLESFGNARTQRNDNSSRFGKLMKLQFKSVSNGASVELIGGSVETYLLEKSRVVHQGLGERNFHAMYQLLTANLAYRQRLQLVSTAQKPVDDGTVVVESDSGDSVDLISYFSFLRGRYEPKVPMFDWPAPTMIHFSRQTGHYGPYIRLPGERARNLQGGDSCRNAPRTRERLSRLRMGPTPCGEPLRVCSTWETWHLWKQVMLLVAAAKLLLLYQQSLYKRFLQRQKCGGATLHLSKMPYSE